jgi:hypothetical protein
MLGERRPANEARNLRVGPRPGKLARRLARGRQIRVASFLPSSLLHRATGEVYRRASERRDAGGARPRHKCPAEATACRSGVRSLGDVLEARAAFAASDGAKAAAAWAKASALGSISVPPWPSLTTG